MTFLACSWPMMYLFRNSKICGKNEFLDWSVKGTFLRYFFWRWWWLTLFNLVFSDVRRSFVFSHKHEEMATFLTFDKACCRYRECVTRYQCDDRNTNLQTRLSTCAHMSPHLGQRKGILPGPSPLPRLPPKQNKIYALNSKSELDTMHWNLQKRMGSSMLLWSTFGTFPEISRWEGVTS